MNVGELKAQRDRERQKTTFVHLDDDYFESVTDWIDDLEDDADAADTQADESRIRDRREQAISVLESIIDRRQGKLIKQASLDSSGYATDTDAMTPAERAAFDDITDRLEEHRDEVLP